MQKFTDCQKEKGVFRKFQDKLFELDIRDEWFVFKQKELKGLAMDWCERSLFMEMNLNLNGI